MNRAMGEAESIEKMILKSNRDQDFLIEVERKFKARQYWS